MDCILGAQQYIKNDSVDLIITDPPFNLGFGGTTQTKTKRPRFNIIANDKLSFRDYQRFTIQWLKEAYRILKPKHHIYVCIDWRMYSYLFLWMRHVGFTLKNLIVWDKVQFGMGWQYRYQHELVIFATKGSQQVRRIAKRNIPDVWSIKRIPGNKTIHPTEKPKEFFINMIKNSSYPGELVVDFFCGSGASAEAVNEMNDRDFIGFEIDPQHYDTIQTRLSLLRRENNE